jgi:hypothetical protein
MFSMFFNSVKLFVQGRLFRDYAMVLRLWVVAFAIAVALIVLLAIFVNPWLGAIVGGLVSGALMPYLFRNLKYN